MRSLQAAIVTLVLSFLPVLAPAQEAPPPAETAAKVDAVFAQWNSRATPGCAVAVETDGQRVLTRAYGMADLEHDVPITPETVFEAGSVSKQFTAAAVVTLAQQGKLSLDDDVRKHIPEVPDYGTPITLRNLMQHTSGLRDWGSVAELEGWPRGLRVHTHSHMLEIVSRQKALNFPTGSEHSYSNSGFNLMAVLVDRVSGQPFAEFTRKLLFEPLGMTRTEWRDDYTRVVKGRAIAYSSEDDGYHSRMPFENVHGNGGLLTTVGDLLLWNQNFEHKKVGGSELAAELQKRGRLTDGREIEYGGGLYMTSYCGVPEVSHGGATGGYRAFLARYPEQRLSVALLCNVAEADSGALAHQVAEIYLPEGVCKETATPGAGSDAIPMAAADLESKAGLYRNLRTGLPVRLLIKEGKLQTHQGDELLPLSGTTFESRPGRSRIEFDLAPDGRPKFMRATTPSGDVLSFERMADFAPKTEDLAAYSGEFHSDEARATYMVGVEEGGLVVRRRPDFSVRLEPAYADAFTIPGGLVRFFRGADGKVSEMSFGSTRVRDMRFRRVR